MDKELVLTKIADSGVVAVVRAENGDHVQIMTLSLTKYNYNIIDLIKSLSE